MSRDIHHFHRRFNYTSQYVHRIKCEASLKHSLRMIVTLAKSKAKAKPSKKSEWNNALSDKNLVWCNGKLSKLGKWSNEERLELLYRISPAPRIHNQKKLQTQHRQYRLKMKKAVSSELKKGNNEAAEFLQEILDTQGHVSYSRIEKFEKLTMQRKSQRVRMLETYLNAHNQVQNRAPTNAVYLQEGILKVPHQWKVGSDILTLEEYIEFTRKFLAYYFPQYPIEAIIGHDDERSVEQNTGCHPHYFLSGRNSETGEFDLHKKQIQVVNEYIRQVYSVEEFFPSNGNLTREESQDFGMFFQKMVKDFANEHLFHAKGLNVVFAPLTEQQSEQRKEMNREASLAKSERSYNYHSHQLELLQDKIALTEKRHARLLKEQEKVELHLTKTIDDAAQAQARLSQLEVERDTMKIEVSDLKVETSRLATLTQELTQALVPKLVDIFKKVLLAINAKDKNMAKKQSEYLESAFNTALELPPSVARGFSRELATVKKAATPTEAELSVDK
ncbi:hypothetical protein CGI22_15900 [Vibrio parahaemolyticus]|uniref:hypothetical protein n=1 Tax=Vibrio parahaemolyticus TaxID=670 RepID=UPI0011208330|nr:hypothetical protein [Vibrio parahaemolyticus]TOK22675.1 hypothetical protein CGI22_15900 [Vibrio parahaemolyticus]